MYRIIVLSAVFLIEAGFQPAVADMHANIYGALPVATIPKAPPPIGAAVEEALPKHGIAAQKPAGLIKPIKPNSTPSASAMAPVTLLFDRRLGKAEKEADLPPDLLDAILRIEGVYDPTPVDIIDDAPRMEIRAGTAVMDNVFADRWRRYDTDPNVHLRVRYLAQAWMRKPEAGCDDFFKRRPSVQGFALSALSAEDCARLKGLQDTDDRQWALATLTEARISVPVFAAPLPGARLSSNDFWAAQRAKIAAINSRLKDKWQITSTGPAR